MDKLVDRLKGIGTLMLLALISWALIGVVIEGLGWPPRYCTIA